MGAGFLVGVSLLAMVAVMDREQARSYGWCGFFVGASLLAMVAVMDREQARSYGWWGLL